jgi:transposase
LAQLHAAGLLVGIWGPPKPIRDLRALIAQRWKMVHLATIAKNRLHSALHRHHLDAPDSSLPFWPKQKEFWLNLLVSAIEHADIQCDWDTVEFADQQRALLEETIAKAAAEDERVLLLVQLPGIEMIDAMTLLAAIGDITRFASAKELVGYAGLGTRVHDSGHLHQSGRITKAGREDIRHVMVEAAQSAARTHLHWKAELARLEPRQGCKKAIVAIARKLLVFVWYADPGRGGSLCRCEASGLFDVRARVPRRRQEPAGGSKRVAVHAPATRPAGSRVCKTLPGRIATCVGAQVAR